MGAFLYDLRYGVRMLLKNKGFTAVVVLTLALGIGANSAIFSVVNAVLLRPLPFKDSNRLVWVWETQSQLDKAPFTPADFLDYQAQNQSFEQVATFFSQSLTLTGEEQPVRLRSAIVSANFFSSLGVEPFAGRTFLPEEGQPGTKRVAVMSHGLWQRSFGSDPNLIGKSLMLNGVEFSVIGIMPPDFRYPNIATELWINPRNTVPELSIGSADDVRVMRNSHWLPMIGRLKPGVTLAQAQADMESVSRRLGQQYGSDHGVRVISLHERITGDVRPALLSLLGAVGLVLLIACANVGNLLLARAASRQKEIAIRTALGAGRLRLIRQLLTESMLLALIGGAVGMWLAYRGINLLISILPADTPRLKEINLDLQVFGFTLLISLMTGLIFGLAPALKASRLNLNESLKERVQGAGEGIRRNRVRSLLVISEVAISLIILIGASLLIKSFQRLQDVDQGFNPANQLTLQLSLPAAKYKEPEKQAAFFQQMFERLEILPGAQSVAVANDLPLDGSMQTSTPYIEGRTVVPGQESVAGVHTVSHNYFQAMGIPLLAGRAFTSADAQGAQPVIIINHAMARRLFADEEPLGKRIKFSDDPKVPWKQIVGVVGNMKHNGIDVEDQMETYMPFLQSPRTIMAVAIRSASDPTSLTSAVRSAILEIDKDQPIYDVKTMSQRVSEAIAPRRLSMTLFSFFAGIAVVLAAVGIYGVMSYSVNQRTHEFGIRMALGARAADVLKLVIMQGIILILAGVAIGVLAALAATRLMSSLLYGVSATDPYIFVVISLVLTVVALLACYIPARRATKVDPMIALRYE
ncbi:MAG TPA: ABC transporter permease [Pyrinomonadaceae bacterium]